MADFKNKVADHFEMTCRKDCHGCGGTEFDLSEQPAILPFFDAKEGAMEGRGLVVVWRRCLHCNALLFVEAQESGLV